MDGFSVDQEWVIGWKTGWQSGKVRLYALSSHTAVLTFLARWLRRHTLPPETYWIERCARCHQSHRKGGCKWEGQPTSANPEFRSLVIAAGE